MFTLSCPTNPAAVHLNIRRYCAKIWMGRMAQPGTRENQVKKPIRDMPCLPPTETGEQHVQHHEIFVQLFLCEISFIIARL